MAVWTAVDAEGVLTQTGAVDRLREPANHVLVAQPHSSNQDAGAITVEGVMRAHNAVLENHSLGVPVAGH